MGLDAAFCMGWDCKWSSGKASHIGADSYESMTPVRTHVRGSHIKMYCILRRL